MGFGAFRRYLLPQQAEQDGEFRQELQKISHLGLRTVGAIEIAVPIFMYLAQLAVASDSGNRTGRFWHTVSLVTVGVVTSGIARLDWSRRHARLLAVISAWFGAAVLIWASVLMAPQSFGADDYIPGGVTLVMLGTVAAIPLKPTQTLALGLWIECFYLLSSWAAAHWNLLASPDSGPSHVLFILMLTLLSTALSAIVSGQRESNFLAHRQALRVTEDLCNAQFRALLSENAVSIGRLAAALTHELNTPIGALKNSVDTLVVLAARQATAPVAEQPRFVAMQADLRRSIRESADRLQQVVARLQRFVDLDHTERQDANLNELLGDVAILFEPQIKGKVKVEFDFHPLRSVSCRRQQLSAVFSSLLSNAINAVNGDGRIVISTEQKNSQVEVRIRDNGRGMSSEELETIFAPGFKVSEGRVSTGNWSLFSSRQIIYEHGGEIRIDSAEGKGTTVSVTLPC